MAFSTLSLGICGGLGGDGSQRIKEVMFDAELCAIFNRSEDFLPSHTYSLKSGPTTIYRFSRRIHDYKIVH
ncbi:hypothetical protein K435DRAFT_782799 [Dendrothele bispora CBS 962.96]|uniref:Uncharacterized protein n=1 Tax=Dendrothele bispora (strain CBS 962.96) TaxID=1314807 RepID=A0A4S8LCH6_DENBC|nr:hypothetical protein K435DRAFT_782799 [Dendrothele bispora CBS 962.96]